jgi:hypothetical protein
MIMAMTTPTVRRGFKLSAGGAVLIAAVASGLLAWVLIALPVVNFSAKPSHPAHFPLVFAHMAGGTLMLFLGAANLYIGTTRKFSRWHKPVGYLYLGGGAVAATSAIYLALAPLHGENASPVIDLFATTDLGWALASLGAAWLASAALAFRAVKNRRFDQHRQWMIRSYVLTWSFVLCRLLATQPAMQELGDGAAAAWLSWIVPFFICEIALQWKAGGKTPKSAL